MTNERILIMNQPNILILHLDELRQDCLGCYGNPDIQTPNIDALAADGVTYQNHYTVIRSVPHPAIRYSAVCMCTSMLHGTTTAHFPPAIRLFRSSCARTDTRPPQSEKCI